LGGTYLPSLLAYRTPIHHRCSRLLHKVCTTKILPHSYGSGHHELHVNVCCPHFLAGRRQCTTTTGRTSRKEVYQRCMRATELGSFAALYHIPSSTGLAERYVQLVMAHIRQKCIERGTTRFWSDWVYTAGIGLNTRLVRVHGYQPSNLMLGYTPTLYRREGPDGRLLSTSPFLSSLPFLPKICPLADVIALLVICVW
jgi:hypothetical protein